MPKFIDRTGQVFGRLTVLHRAGTSAFKKVFWKCLCSCGKEVNVPAGALVTKNTKSCGCMLEDTRTKHGGTGKGSYNTWRAMIRRCNNPLDKDYPRYGGVGTAVCDRWLDYKSFVADMDEPVGDETLDRINVYGNYEPSNCRWAGVSTQNRNVRVRKNSKTGFVGVIARNNKYYASITVNKKKYQSTFFSTIQEAAEARKVLEQKYWGSGG